MKKAALFTGIFLLSFFVSNFYAQSLDDLIKESDKAYAEFNNQKSLDAVLKADKKYPNNWEVQWRISRGYVKIAEHMPTNNGDEQDAQEAVYNKALSYANNAINLAGDKSITYLRRAIANGRIALFKGIFTVAGVVKSVRDDCLQAIKLGNGGNEIQALAHYILARTHGEVSKKSGLARAIIGLGWADNEVAIEEYKKAIALNPEFIMFYIDYASSLEREDMYKDAKEALNRAFRTSIKDDEDNKRLAEGRKLYEEIKDKN